MLSGQLTVDQRRYLVRLVRCDHDFTLLQDLQGCFFFCVFFYIYPLRDVESYKSTICTSDCLIANGLYDGVDGVDSSIDKDDDDSDDDYDNDEDGDGKEDGDDADKDNADANGDDDNDEDDHDLSLPLSLLLSLSSSLSLSASQANFVYLLY